MGCSPYFVATGTQALMPLDIVEATYLLPPPDSIISTTDLIARRAVALQKRRTQLRTLHSKVFDKRRNDALIFERDHEASIKNYGFQRGDLVLVRFTQFEKSLDRKMLPRYDGPFIVIGRRRGGPYVLCDMHGAVFDRPTAEFRVIPYFTRPHITLPPLPEFIDIPARRLNELLGQPDPEAQAQESRSIDSDA
ncbi:hypothetical protein FA95DRAFT_1506433 [Auriscalpium vulgare]|uniref:Uncharacterized protein n=1 Tax=Auriscalpium vulgare TaxID=40419 RepID=A0ACB8R214_9AGAM|nr:hypothetical protein FA95DRAFT_1506433 [Auriscalpium vulgare]